MKLYFKYLSILLRSQMQYRTSFILLSIGQFFVPFSIFISMYLLFQRFDHIGGWNLYEVALCYAIIHIGFSVSECFARGFDAFPSYVVKGEFDRILVRPRSTVLQVLGARFEFSRIGRFSQSIIVMIYALINLSIEWDFIKIITLLFMILSGVIIFTGVYMLGATLSFWTIQGIEAINIVTDGGREMSQYPLTIYKDWVKKFFTFIIPFGTVNYLPLMYILDKTNGNDYFYMVIPLFGMLFIIPSLMIWKFGVKHYKSTGS